MTLFIQITILLQYYYSMLHLNYYVYVVYLDLRLMQYNYMAVFTHRLRKLWQLDDSFTGDLVQNIPQNSLQVDLYAGMYQSPNIARFQRANAI